MKKLLLFISILLILSACSNTDRNWKPEGPMARNLVTFVQKAATMINEEGIACFDSFRANIEWNSGDRYIFVWGMDGTRFVYPPDPAGEGKLMLDLKDSEGKPIGMEFIRIAQQGGGWIHYKWPKPGETKPEWKSTYIFPATAPNGAGYLVGSGVYGIKK
ncbi:MAG: cache domain-containing protein [Candidatus Cloacimonetes bacterium]|nr:cache domain-containing protein [Candidatus Cloacimonadota bacterium]